MGHMPAPTPTPTPTHPTRCVNEVTFIPGIQADIRTANLIGISGVVFTWQYIQSMLFILVTGMHNSRPVFLYSCQNQYKRKQTFMFIFTSMERHIIGFGKMLIEVL